MKFQKTILTAVLSASALILLGACGNKAANNSGNSNSGVSLNFNGQYSARNNKESGPLVSFYRNNLNGNQQKLYDDVLETIKQHRTSYLLATSLPKEEVQQVMAIVFMDNPDLFFVDKKYQYSVNDEGKIKNLTFSYNKTKEEEQAITDQLEKSAQLGEINMNELTPVKLASMFNSFNASKFVAEPTTLGDVSGRIDTVNINNQTLSNFIVFALRRNKIPASIVYGENINSSYSNLPDAFDNGNVTDSGSEVVFNTSKIYSWVIVRIKEEYFHFDIWMNEFFKNYVHDKTGFEVNYNPFLGMTDEQAANSRLMDVGRQYLGTSEYADTPEKTMLYNTDASYVVSSDNELRKKLQEDLTHTLAGEQGVKNRIFKFISNPRDYTRLSPSIEMQLKGLNLDKYSLRSYDFFTDSYSQSFAVYNIIADMSDDDASKGEKSE